MSDSEPLTPGFDSLAFTATAATPTSAASEHHLQFPSSPRQLASSDTEEKHEQAKFQYEPGIIRKMKKSGKYGTAANPDVFEQGRTPSRPVSVASLNLSDVEGGDKEERFNALHKPVLFLKSCPSPATFLHKKLAAPDPASLLGKLTMLEGIIKDIQGARLEEELCGTCGFQHHPTERCLHLDAFESGGDSETEVHCNPIFAQSQEQRQMRSKKKIKKRRKVAAKGTQGRDSDSDG